MYRIYSYIYGNVFIEIIIVDNAVLSSVFRVLIS